MFYVEQDYIVVNYFIDGGAARRFRKYDGAEHLRKLYPSLRDDEPIPEKRVERKSPPERSTDTAPQLPQFDEIALEIPPLSDFSAQAPGVNFEQLAEIARRLASQPVQIPRSQLVRMSIDEIERMSEGQLNFMMNDGQADVFLSDPAIKDWDDAIWMKN